jgi:lipopolysaccharide/colanic/teichoic acid biosynthesis glycosyltransferase
MSRPVSEPIYRARDVLLSAAGLIVLSPVLLVAALAVALSSPGPVIFAQVRVGLHGRQFRLYKFRTMRAGAAGAMVTVSGDRRITGIGRILRATKLDELPQLVNVLKGDMSLVGPRPEVPELAALWPADLAEVIVSVRPGITDPATALLRSEEELLSRFDDPAAAYVSWLLPRKARAYADYVRTRSVTGDWIVLFRTVAVVLKPATLSADAMLEGEN